MLLALEESAPVRGWTDYHGPRVTTSVIVGRAGSLYEKLRYTLDYTDEHAIRRHAIERTLRRLLVFELNTDLGATLLTELVRAGYVPNNSVPTFVGDELQHIIDRYAELRAQLHSDRDQVWALAATEIEQHLFPQPYQEYVFDALYQRVLTYLHPREEHAIDESTFRLQVYVACRERLLHDTDPGIRFALWRIMEPIWGSTLDNDEEGIRGVATRFCADRYEQK
jgi:hypothetical protein